MAAISGGTAMPNGAEVALIGRYSGHGCGELAALQQTARNFIDILLVGKVASGSRNPFFNTRGALAGIDRSSPCTIQ